MAVANISYGGISVAAPPEWKLGEEVHLKVRIEALGQAQVRCAVRWIRRDETGRYWAGLEFLESDKGWLGPPDAEDTASLNGRGLL